MKKNIFSLTAAAILLAACSSGTMINADGTPKGDIQWPDASDTQFDGNKGTFPDLDNLGNIRPNMTRDQLYGLIGRPHFTEGFHVREWTYLFHFDTPGKGTNGVSTCEFKVLFDKSFMAQSYFWKAIDPVEGVKGICEGEKPKPEIYTLNADALFAFNKSNLGSISDEGKAELQNLVAELQKFEKLNSVKISGHTDYIGSNSYNKVLSKKRANSVKQYLMNSGLNTKIIAIGRGESSPVKTCDSNQPRADLVNCLAPNRRVEITVDGYAVKEK